MILENEQFIELRKKFIDNFLDVNSGSHKDYFENRILRTEDGLRHSGYFWELLKTPEIIKEQDIYEYLSKIYDDTIYVLWDNNIFLDKLKYPFFAALQLKIFEFKKIVNFLPQDYYLFDKAYKWVFAVTHENIGDERYCLFAHF